MMHFNFELPRNPVYRYSNPESIDWYREGFTIFLCLLYIVGTFAFMLFLPNLHNQSIVPSMNFLCVAVFLVIFILCTWLPVGVLLVSAMFYSSDLIVTEHSFKIFGYTNTPSPWTHFTQISHAEKKIICRNGSRVNRILEIHLKYGHDVRLNQKRMGSFTPIKKFIKILKSKDIKLTTVKEERVAV
jgi:hypothetical protein